MLIRLFKKLSGVMLLSFTCLSAAYANPFWPSSESGCIASEVIAVNKARAPVGKYGNRNLTELIHKKVRTGFAYTAPAGCTALVCLYQDEVVIAKQTCK